jgi:hypothetical protein
MNKEPVTIPYSRILDRRARAIQIDLGGENPVWFPLQRITLDEDAYTVTGPKALMTEKLAEAGGAKPQYNPFGKRMVKLAAPAWENEKAIGIDVVVTRMTGSRDAIRQRVFFSKAQVENGAAPLWLVNRKEQELLARICQSGRYAPEQFSITGLRGRDKEPAAAPQLGPEPVDVRRAAKMVFG